MENSIHFNINYLSFSMKRIIFLLTALLASKGYCANNPDKSEPGDLTSADFNGMYETVVDLEPNWTRSRKSLVRIHIFVYDFEAENFPEKIALPSKKTVFARPALVYKEVFYLDKKGQKPPKREFYTAYAYLYGDNLEITSQYMKEGARDRLKRDSKKGWVTTGVLELSRLNRDLKITNPNGEVEIPLGSGVNGIFTKKVSYKELPAVFEPYLDLILNQNASGTFTLARDGYKSNATYFYAKKLEWSDRVLDVYVGNSGWQYGKRQLSMNFLKDTENKLIRTAENEKTGLHTSLMYFPALETLRMHLDYPDDGDKSNIMNLKIENKVGEIRCKAEYTDNGKDFFKLATQADEERKRAEEKRNEIAEQNRIVALAAEKKRIAEYAKAGFTIKPDYFWTDYPLNGGTLRAFHEGDFENVYNETIARILLLSYREKMNGTCRNLLPPNKKKIEYEYTSQEKEYAGTTYNGGWDLGSFTDHYNTVEEKHRGEYYIDPRFEEIYRTNSETLQRNYLKSAFNPSFNPFKYIAEVKEVKSFINALNCNKDDMYTIGENLLRYFQGQKSLQAEKGIGFH